MMFMTSVDPEPVDFLGGAGPVLAHDPFDLGEFDHDPDEALGTKRVSLVRDPDGLTIPVGDDGDPDLDQVAEELGSPDPDIGFEFNVGRSLQHYDLTMLMMVPMAKAIEPSR